MTGRTFSCDGRAVAFTDGDTILAALFRAGVHSGGGCLCAAGDCPNCLAVVDGIAYSRTCLTVATPGLVVRSQSLHEPPVADPSPADRGRVVSRTDHTDVVVIGAGRSGRDAAALAAGAGRKVVMVDAGAGETAVGIYPGPMVVCRTPDGMRQIHCGEVVVATGARETQPACPGNDLIGIATPRAIELLTGAGVDLGVVVAVGDPPSMDGVTRVDGTLVRFEAHPERPAAVGAVVVRVDDGTEVAHPCDTVSVGLGRQPRDLLARMGHGLGARAVGSAATAGVAQPVPTEGVVCRCSGVTVDDLQSARARGFNEMDLVKRATLAGTGTCQGSACMPHLQAWLHAGREVAAPFTARPLARPLTMGEVAANFHPPVVRRTPLHRVHVALGARMERTGGWWRPWTYGDPSEEYRSVRERVSLGDVSTLGKFIVSGPDAPAFLDRVYPVRVSGQKPGRSRYVLLLDEAGYVMDDGMVCRQSETRWFLTFTSAGGGRAEMWLRDWAAAWDMDVRILDQTMSLGAINVTGPRTGELMRRAGLGPPMAFADHGPRTIAGVDSLVFRLSFTGEVSYEIHHPASRSVELWQALTGLGQDLGVGHHGLDTLVTLRLEKGHIIVGQDTDMDSTVDRIDHRWAVSMADDRDFIGRAALERIAGFPADRRLIGFTIDTDTPSFEGDTVFSAGKNVGYTTSMRFSPALGMTVGLAWVRLDEQERLPEGLSVADQPMRPTTPPFYDPDGGLARA